MEGITALFLCDICLFSILGKDFLAIVAVFLQAGGLEEAFFASNQSNIDAKVKSRKKTYEVACPFLYRA